MVDVAARRIDIIAFTPHSQVKIEVRTSASGPQLFAPVTQQTDEMGSMQFKPSEPMRVGYRVAVTDVATNVIKTLDVAQLSVDGVDQTLDTVSGTAAPGATAYVTVIGPEPGSRMAQVVAEGSGSWVADFSPSGSDSGWDIREGTSAIAGVVDDDGDATSTSQQPGCPRRSGTCFITVSPGNNQIFVQLFTPMSPIRIDVFDSDGRSRLNKPRTTKSDPQGNAGADLGIDLQGGDRVDVTDETASVTKSIVVPPLTVDEVDYENDRVSGRSAPGDEVALNAGAAIPGRVITAADGTWSVDFRALGTEIPDGASVVAVVTDDDGDQAIANLGPGCPRPALSSQCAFGASIEHDNIHLFSFTPDSQVEIEVFESRGGRSIYGPVRGDTDDEGEFITDFGVNPGPDLRPGNFIRVTDLATSTVKELELQDLEIESVDPATDLVAGHAPPNSTLGVHVACESTRQIDLAAGPDGRWIANFGAIGFDIGNDTSFFAFIGDSDGDNDKTADHLGAPLLRCEAETCGSAGDDTLRIDDGDAESGGGEDTVVATPDGSTEEVIIDSGKDDDGIVIEENERAPRQFGYQRAPRQLIPIRANSGGGRDIIIVPADVDGLLIFVTTGRGADEVEMRNYGDAKGDRGRLRIDGGAGNDRIQGSKGKDILIGGSGHDICFVTRGDKTRGCEEIKQG